MSLTVLFNIYVAGTVGPVLETVTAKRNELLLDSHDELVTRIGFKMLDYWNTDGRPSSPKELVFGYNISSNTIEVHSGGAWRTVGLS